MVDEEHTIEEEVIDDTKIEDELESDIEDQSTGPQRFDISSYGWDVDVEGLVKRMNREDVYLPGFQRGFVWSRTDKSRFIESLILGLPVPTLFLARDSVTQKLNIIDGQQRLKTLQSYFNGEFSLAGKEIPEDLKGLYHSNRRSPHGVEGSEKYRRAYPKAKILNQADERTLSDAVVHSIVIRPNPKDDDENLGREYNEAIIQIFKRLNTTGKALNAQEVRASIFHGSFLDLITELNKNTDWRALFGKPHSRMKDQEIILRALALFESADQYKSPMPRFLDTYMEANRKITDEHGVKLKLFFDLAVKLIRDSLGDDALKRGGTFMLTRLDALVVGLMEAFRTVELTDGAELEASVLEKMGDRSVSDRLVELEADDRGLNENGEEIEDCPADERGYNWSVAKFTNDTNRVKARLNSARAVFTLS